jgi:hypothetical protein
MIQNMGRLIGRSVTTEKGAVATSRCSRWQAAGAGIASNPLVTTMTSSRFFVPVRRFDAILTDNFGFLVHLWVAQ